VNRTIPSMSSGTRPASAIATFAAYTARFSSVLPESLVYLVSPTPTMAHLSLTPSMLIPTKVTVCARCWLSWQLRDRHPTRPVTQRISLQGCQLSPIGVDTEGSHASCMLPGGEEKLVLEDRA
jgi:hypothetical protein